MIEKGAAGAAEQRGKLRPGVRGAHVDDTDRLDPRARRFGINEMRGFPGLHAAPELLLGRYQDTQVEGVHGDRHLDPLASDPHIVLDLGHILLGSGFLRERPGQHEFGLEYRSSAFHDAVSGWQPSMEWR